MRARAADTSPGRLTLGDRAKLHQVRGISNPRTAPNAFAPRETERVLRKFDLSREQAKAVERVSRSLVDNLLHAPIAKVTAIF